MTPAQNAAAKRKRLAAAEKAGVAREKRVARRKAVRSRRQAAMKRKGANTANSSSVTPKEVAEWMLAQIDDHCRLLQVEAVAAIEKMFGADFVYLSEINEMSIDRRVLRQFSNLTGDDVVYVTRRGIIFSEDDHWRLREIADASSDRRRTAAIPCRNCCARWRRPRSRDLTWSMVDIMGSPAEKGRLPA